MDVETIIKLIDAGYTKAEIEQMTKAPAQDPAPDPAPAEAPDPEPAPDPAPEAEPVKKNSSPDGEENSKLLALEEKMKNLENQFYQKNLNTGTIPTPPKEDDSVSAIFTKVFSEE